MINDTSLVHIEEIAKTIIGKKGKIADTIFTILKQFKLGTLAARSGISKQQGFKAGHILNLFILFPFLSISSVRAFYHSGFSRMTPAQKDVLFRLKNNPFYNWRKLLYMVAQRFKVLSKEKRSEYYKETTTCLILDDTIQPKKGKRLEAIGKVFDHVLHKYLLGMKGLFLSYWDGISTIPLDFSFHSEKGKNQKRPYGFSKRELQARYSKARPRESCGHKRFQELKKSKIENGPAMIKRALRFGFIPRYVLTDSWFSTKEFIRKVRSFRNGSIDFLGQVRLDKRKPVYRSTTDRYLYQGFEYTGKELRHLLRGRMKRSKVRKAYYIEVVVFYAGIGEIKLFFSRFSKRSKWHLLMTTDLTLSYNKALKLYNNRWTIEVMFKELKQYLNFGKCQSNDFDAQIADTTISLITYTILSLHKQVVEYIPLGQVFRKWKDQLLESTLAERLWRLFVGLILSFIQIFELDIPIEELLKKIFQTQQGNQIIKQLLIGQSVEPLLESC